MKKVTVIFLVDDEDARTVEEEIRNTNPTLGACIFDAFIQKATDDEVESFDDDGDDWEDDDDYDEWDEDWEDNY